MSSHVQQSSAAMQDLVFALYGRAMWPVLCERISPSHALSFVQVGNLKALKNETNIPLVQLLDAPTTVIPGEPTNRVGYHSLRIS